MASEKKIYSHSRISTFEQCPLKFKFSYIDELETEIGTTVEAFLGSRVHETLEKLYNDLKFQKLNSCEELLEFYTQEWTKNWNEKVLIVRQEFGEQNFRLMGERFIKDYYARYHPFDQARTIGLEMRIEIKLDQDGRYVVQGFIDRLACSAEGVYEIHDYKTSNSLPDQEKLEADRQLALYSIAVREKYQDCKKVVLIWHYLAFDKELRSERTDEQLLDLRSQIIESIKKIESALEFPAVESNLCSWCEFRPICPKWKHLYELEKKSPEEFLSNDGVKLVNEYADLKNQEALLAKKLEDTSSKIITFSERFRIDKIFGSDVKVTVWKKNCVKFPNRQEIGYFDLLKAVREAGGWENYSTLDKFKLEKDFENLDMDHKLMENIAKFGKKEMIKKLYLGKIQ